MTTPPQLPYYFPLNLGKLKNQNLGSNFPIPLNTIIKNILLLYIPIKRERETLSLKFWSSPVSLPKHGEVGKFSFLGGVTS